MNCENCAYYAYDDEYECYVCEVTLDEDEMCRFLSGSTRECPYYRNGDEYAVARKQADIIRLYDIKPDLKSEKKEK